MEFVLGSGRASGSGIFLSVEGGEGVGKSAFISRLQAKLAAMGKTVYLTREPGGTPSADKIRRLFGEPAEGDPYSPRTEAFLVNAARAQHVDQVIRPRLAKGEWILCDRFADSTRVYQGALGNLDHQFLESTIDLATQGLEPDLTFILDCDVKVAMERVAGRKPDADAIKRFDEASLATHEKIRAAFLELAQTFAGRCAVLDASQPVDEVLAQGLQALEEHRLV